MTSPNIVPNTLLDALDALTPPFPSKPVYGPIGSVSHATMREQDLIPCFVDLLAELAGEADVDVVAIRAELAAVERWANWTGEDSDNCPYWESDAASYDLNETLFERLNEYAPPYFYFGAHPGDGSDYGYWLSDDVRQLVQDDGGLIIADLDEIPDNYTGEALLINDHGNTSLYSVQNGKYTEVWAVV